MQNLYLQNQVRGFPGAMDGITEHNHTWSRLNPAKPQAGTLVVGGTAADGVYSAFFTDPNDPEHPITVSFTRADSEANAAIAAALYAKAIKEFILRAAVTLDTLTATYVMHNADLTYTVVTAHPVGATLVWTQTVAAGGVTVPFGRFVKGGGDGLTYLPVTTGTVLANILGVLVRELIVEQVRDSTEDDGLPPGRDGTILGSGAILVRAEEAVTRADTPYVRITASATLTDLGVVGKSADGGNCISLANVARFDGEAAAGEVVRVIVHIPLPPA
jgi:hypothetical protein